MKIEKIAISLLVNDPNNARKHDKKNIMSIKGSLAKFKQQKPLVVDHNNVVLAGNGTLQAALELGWTEIDIVRSDLEGFNATAYALADNKTSDLSEFDNDVLNATLEALKNVDFDLPSIGFDMYDKDFSAGTEDDQGKLDEKQKNICPHCGMEI
jgi:ParB-like chromosome segregation protein Spo0J